MSEFPQWRIGVPQDLKYFPIQAKWLFDAGRLGKMNKILQGRYEIQKGVVVPADIGDIAIQYLGSEPLEDVMVRLGFLAQVINYVIYHGVKRFIDDPHNAGHGFYAVGVRSSQLCKDLTVVGNGTAAIIDIDNKAQFEGGVQINVELAPKNTPSSGRIFDADIGGRGREGIFLRR